MFYNLKDQILKSTEASTEYRYRRYFFQKVPNIVPSALFWKSIYTVIVGTLKIPSANLWQKDAWVAGKRFSNYWRFALFELMNE